MKRGLQTRDAEMNLAQGREVIATIFAQSSPTRGSGTYTAEFRLDEHTTFLGWVGTMDGHKIESLEVIVDNEQGLIVERPIALRPYPALKLFRDAMYASLKDKLPPDVWDYPTPQCDHDRRLRSLPKLLSAARSIGSFLCIINVPRRPEAGTVQWS